MRFPKLILALGALASVTAAAPVGEPGVWAPARQFVQLNAGCMRAYTCGPANAVMYSESQRLVSTPPEEAFGVCATAPGDSIKKCAVCLTSPPEIPCEWHLEDK